MIHQRYSYSKREDQFSRSAIAIRSSLVKDWTGVWRFLVNAIFRREFSDNYLKKIFIHYYHHVYILISIQYHLMTWFLMIDEYVLIDDLIV